MAAPIIGISFFALLLIAPVAIIMVLGVFKLIAWLGNAVLGRTRPVHNEHRGLGFRHVIAGAIPICVIVVLMVMFKAGTDRSVNVYSPRANYANHVLAGEERPATIVQDGAVHAAKQLAEARQEALQAVQAQVGQIPVDLPIEAPVEASKPTPEPLSSELETTAAPVEEPAQPAAAEPSTVVVSTQVIGETNPPDAASTGVVTTTEPITTEPITSNPPSDDPAAAATPATQPAVDDTTSTTAVGSDLSAIPVAETPVQRQARLTELAAHISPWIRSLLKESQQEDAAVPADVAEAVESSDKQIVVFQLAGPIRQKYALIPLTPAFDAALSPVAPFLANGSLESIAESLANFLKKPAETPPEVSASSEGTETPAATESVPTVTSDPSAPKTTTVALTETTGGAEGDSSVPDENRIIYAEGSAAMTPEWVDHPQPHQFVVRSDAVFPGESTIVPLNKAINEALPEHLKLYEESLDPALCAQARLVKLELDEATTQACVIKTYERLQSVGKDGSDKQDMRLVYALVELPESVKVAAVQTVRMSLQRDRVTGLAVIVGLAWLAICSASVVARLWGRGGFFRKMIAIPILCLISIPLLLLAIGTGAATAGIPGSKMPRYPWAESSKPVRIHVS